MNAPRDTHAFSVTDTARGITVLTVITIIAGTWLFALAAAATGIVKIFAGVLLPAIGGGIVAW